MPELDQAIDQISEIHRRLAHTEVYRGFRSVPMALSGGVGLLGGFLQTRFLGEETGKAFVWYWSGVALIAFLVGFSGTILYYLKMEDAHDRKRTRHVIGQFLPSHVAGLLVTVALYPFHNPPAAMLPGIWAILYSLGMFSARPYLPRNIGWVALGYLFAGAVLLVLAPGGSSLSPWGMGLTFGLGQLACAGVLYWDLERKNNDW